MESKTQCINSQLLERQEEWLKECNADSISKEFRLSRPFSFAITSEYIKSSNRIMIVGQEARDFCSYEDDWPLKNIQCFNIDYTRTQLGYCKIKEYNRSPFWKLFRKIHKQNIEPVWNNLDKFHRINSAKETVPLTVELEEKFDSTYGGDYKSLLQREIEITNPDIILFVIGPLYYEALSFSFGIDTTFLLDFKPNPKEPCRDVSKILELGIPVLWSYHPAYLNRIKALDTVVKTVEDIITSKKAV